MVPRRVRRWALAFALGAGLALSLAACGGGTALSTATSKQFNGTPAGTYTIPVTATSGSQQVTTLVQLNVQ
jgi:hypothetical protein